MRTRGLCFCLLLALTGCGNIGDERGFDSNSGDGGTPGSDAGNTLGPQLRRLSAEEYANSVRDAFRLTPLPLDTGTPGRPIYAPITSLPPDFMGASGFPENATTPAELDLYAYFGTGDHITTDHLQDLLAVAPCDPTAQGEEACARGLIRGLAPLYRGTLDTDAENNLFQLYQAVRAIKPNQTDPPPSPQESSRVMVSGMLSSPSFLYLGFSREVGTARTPLSPADLEARLARFFWASIPDATGLSAAAGGKLQDDASVSAEVDRLMADAPRFSRGLIEFTAQWLGLNNMELLSKKDPAWSPALVAAFRFEVGEFVRQVIENDDAKLSTLLTAKYSAGTPDSVAFYGNPQTSPITDYHDTFKITLPTVREGLLMLPSFLSVYAHMDSSSPVKRGRWVLNNLFCRSMPPPPPNVVMNGDAGAGAATTGRAALEQQVKDPQCAGCHDTLDPLGFPFETFDAIGQYRLTDNGFPVDASTTLNGTDVDGDTKTPVEFVERIAQSKQVQACFATKLFEFALGRSNTGTDDASLQQLVTSFQGSGGDIRALMKAIALSESFRSYLPQ
jgi:hypothetical protein